MKNDEYLSTKFAEFAIEEYKTLRSEIIQKQSIMMGFIQIALGFAGGLIAFALSNKSSDFDTSYAVLVFIVPFFCLFSILYHTFENLQILKIARYIAQLENDINNTYNQRVLFWELGNRLWKNQNYKSLYWQYNKLLKHISSMLLHKKSDNKFDAKQEKQFLIRNITPVLYEDYNNLRKGKYRFLEPIENPFKYDFDLIRITFLLIAIASEVMGLLSCVYHFLDKQNTTLQSKSLIHNIIEHDHLPLFVKIIFVLCPPILGIFTFFNTWGILEKYVSKHHTLYQNMDQTIDIK